MASNPVVLTLILTVVSILAGLGIGAAVTILSPTLPNRQLIAMYGGIGVTFVGIALFFPLIWSV